MCHTGQERQLRSVAGTNSWTLADLNNNKKINIIIIIVIIIITTIIIVIVIVIVIIIIVAGIALTGLCSHA